MKICDGLDLMQIYGEFHSKKVCDRYYNGKGECKHFKKKIKKGNYNNCGRDNGKELIH